jgi:hypothetical protein
VTHVRSRSPFHKPSPALPLCLQRTERTLRNRSSRAKAQPQRPPQSAPRPNEYAPPQPAATDHHTNNAPQITRNLAWLGASTCRRCWTAHRFSPHTDTRRHTETHAASTATLRKKPNTAWSCERGCVMLVTPTRARMHTHARLREATRAAHGDFGLSILYG